MSIQGQQAQDLLDNDAFDAAVADYSRALTEEWARSTKTERREEIWMHQAALVSVVNNLKGYIDNANYEFATRTKEGFFK